MRRPSEAQRTRDAALGAAAVPGREAGRWVGEVSETVGVVGVERRKRQCLATGRARRSPEMMLAQCSGQQQASG